ncbi:DUF2723 domain-containing protein [Cytophagaceae bacterium DM2B3-1]|uniref:DUF2723 domain-containing protein n=1 Tax=Xanthocytophaga flava TaxID=3048013 RepID=A0ABT7CGI5_9BACT|nr:DUF2723 domain-containing protein [Xanthocytophaga flavus]MDJ1473662.1 DUF2723 domain-containing protein [Xanthocytophaga flavus]MDJ1492855.1 DUF2723 domain-containing protein [Xanthocytophaga flavus]
MYSFRKINNLTGWAVFAIAAVTYVRTVEPTVSFWDCGEFIAAAHKLLIGHPPGAPFFLLVAHLFTDALASDSSQVAYWMNVLSALSSAFTILFLFWTITLLGRKLITTPVTEYSIGQTIGLIMAGVVGSLVYTFSDSFWFSAVESEVYALSSLFTAFVVWAMLKWELIDDSAAANRWLLLIAYVIGLSIGTHLLNLVTLPALALIFYFRKFTPTWKGAILTLIVSGIALLFVMNVMRTELPGIAGKMDIFFVNTLGLPFNSGAIVFTILCVSVLLYGIWYSVRKQKVVLNTVLLGFTFILIGYSSYVMLVVRANFNPTFNLNNPKDLSGFMYYMNMEQYGAARPLLYGPNFTAGVVEIEKGSPIYIKGEHKYESYSQRLVPKYDPRKMTLFPRLYSDDETRRHPQLYRNITGLREGENPTLAHQFSYFFKQQIGYFYVRYFLWNFVGRDSDEVGAGWHTTFHSKDTLPPVLSENKAHNRFYGLPLFLGLIGLFFVIQRNRQVGAFTGLLFFMTGIALIIYLNPPPVEPRERDYIYVGSFYAFAIWIGLGVMALSEWIKSIVKQEVLRPVLIGSLCLAVPVLMVKENWDDHDRTGRYMALDSAKNMLESCAPNAILFTTGDNDTYPLLYAQEVEGIRPDVRVVISQFMGTDWYIDYLKQSLGRTPAMPISLEKKNYVSYVNNQILFYENPTVKDGINLKEYIRLIREDNPALKVTLDSGETINTLPTPKLYLPLDKEAIVKSGQIPTALTSLLSDQMLIELPKKHIFKDDLVFLDILAQNDWKRPVYFTTTQLPNQYNLMKHTQLEGVVCRLLPVEVPQAEDGFLNSDIAYNNLMNKSQWRGQNDPTVYHDETCRGERLVASRLAFLTLAQQLMAENQPKKAREVLMRSLGIMPNEIFHDDQICSLYVAPLLQVGEKQKAEQLAKRLTHNAEQNLAYYWEEKSKDQQAIRTSLYILNQVAAAFKEANHPDATRYEALLEKELNVWQN